MGKAAKIGGAAIAAGFAAGAAGIVKMGSTFESVERTLRVGTGATGEALEGLKDITKNLAKNVPADFKDIGTAVADINTRLGLTGKDLDSLILVQYLDEYAEIGDKYVEVLQKIIKQNNLKDFDDAKLLPSSGDLESLI